MAKSKKLQEIDITQPRSGDILLPAVKELEQVVQLGTDANLIKILENKYKDVIPTDAASFKILKEGIANFRNLRGTITDNHQALKAPLLKKGRAIDEEKNKLLDLIKDAEAPLIQKKVIYDAEIERKRREKELAEQARVDKIQARIKGFSKCLEGIAGKSTEQLKADLAFLLDCMENDTFNYEEFINYAEQTKQASLSILNKAYLDKKEFDLAKEKANKEREELEAEKAKLAADRAALEEEKRKSVEEVEKQNIDASQCPEPVYNPTEPTHASTIIVSQFLGELPKGVILIDDPIKDRNISDEELEMERELAIDRLGIIAPVPDIYSEASAASENMQRFGGSFVKYLGAALSHADINNMHKIKNAFPEYWNQYLNWGKSSGK